MRCRSSRPLVLLLNPFFSWGGGRHGVATKIGCASLRDRFPICPRFENIDGICPIIESSSEHAAALMASTTHRPMFQSTALIRSAMASRLSVNRSGGGGGEPQRIGSASCSTAWIRRTGREPPRRLDQNHADAIPVPSPVHHRRDDR